MTKTSFTCKCVLAIFSGIMIAACSPKCSLASGTHPPLLAENVKICESQPSKYELLGTIEVPVTPEAKWDEKGDSTPGFKALLAKAAATTGANGLLLRADANQHDVMVGVGFNDKYYQVPLRLQPKTAVAEAIFVLRE